MTRLALCDVRGLLTDIVEKLSGDDGAFWAEAFKKVCCKENPWPIHQPAKLTWQQAEEKAYELMGLADQYATFRKESGAAEIPGRWILHLVKGISYDKIIAALKKSGSGFWSYYDDLAKKVVHNDRDSDRDGSYAISFLAVVEADRENANKSADELKEEGRQGITLMERLLLELVYFLMTGEHLDIENWTLCAGSRDADGGVPHVSWDPGSRRVGVGCCRPAFSSVSLRSRSAVSLPATPRASAAMRANA